MASGDLEVSPCVSLIFLSFWSGREFMFGFDHGNAVHEMRGSDSRGRIILEGKFALVFEVWEITKSATASHSCRNPKSN